VQQLLHVVNVFCAYFAGISAHYPSTRAAAARQPVQQLATLSVATGVTASRQINRKTVLIYTHKAQRKPPKNGCGSQGKGCRRNVFF
jgi:hypothetical protein